MSVTFSVRGQRYELEDPSSYLNVCNANAYDLLRWLGLPSLELYGSAPAAAVAARCRRRLWDEPRNHDPELPTADSHAGALTVIDPDGAERVVGAEPGPRVIFFGRAPDYLRGRTQKLLELAERAGAETIDWG